MGPGCGVSLTRARQRVVEAHLPSPRPHQFDRTPGTCKCIVAGTPRGTAESSGSSTPGQCESKRAQIAADGFSSRRMARESSDESRSGPGARNSTNRRSVSRASGSSIGSGSRTIRAYPRASTTERAPRSTGTASGGASAAAASSSSDISAIASIASRRSRARSRWTSCSGRSSSSRYARTARAGNLLAQLRGGVPVPLRELLPVRAQHETVVQAPPAARRRSLGRFAAGARGWAGGHSPG